MYNTVFALLGLTLMAWLGAVGPHFWSSPCSSVR